MELFILPKIPNFFPLEFGPHFTQHIFKRNIICQILNKSLFSAHIHYEKSFSELISQNTFQMEFQLGINSAIFEQIFKEVFFCFEVTNQLWT